MGARPRGRLLAGRSGGHCRPVRAWRSKLARAIARRGVTDEARSERLTAALNRLGPSYVKLGQFLATRPDLVGREGAEALGRLRDEIDPFPEAEARATIEKALGRPVEALYSAFSPPVAAASIAQVHKAEITDETGTRAVAVKVLRPGIRRRFRRDLDTFYEGARLVERVDPASRRLRPVAVVDTLARSVTIEMDLRLEAAALSEMAEASAGDPGFRVPVVEWDYTARDVLTLEWVDGIKLSDVAALRAAGHDLPLLARRLMQAFLRQALRDGFFHADMHQGNLFVDAAGDIVAVDYGIMGRLDRDERLFLAEVLFGFIRRDYKRIAEVHFAAGYRSRRQAFRRGFRPGAARHRRADPWPAGKRDLDGAAADACSSRSPRSSTCRPGRNCCWSRRRWWWSRASPARSIRISTCGSAAEPVVREWIERYLGPSGQLELAAEGVGAIGRLASELPRLAERAGRLSAEIDRMSEHGLRLDPETIAGIGRSEAHAARWGRVALWVIAAVAVVAGLKWVF